MSALNKIATKGKLSLGLVFPIEAYKGAVPQMKGQEQLAKRAEEVGFKALWFRDVPFNDPNFGDAGQLYDPWIYMTHIMNHTTSIALATGSIILPLRHPVHTVKAMNSLQELSGGRLIMGVASGDRAIEYPAFNKSLSDKSALFRDSFQYMKALNAPYPNYSSQHYGSINGSIDLLPKTKYATDFLVTGHSGQSLDWIAQNSDGWLYYPRDFKFLQDSLQRWRTSLNKAGAAWKPYLQSLYIDLQTTNEKPSPIHLGFKSGSNYLLAHLKLLESYGVNHVIINLKYSSRPASEVIEQLAKEVLPVINK